MKDAAQTALPFLANDAQRVVFGFAGVNHDRQVALEREPDLHAKHLVLDVARREIVVIVETDLADRAGGRQRIEPRRHRVRGRLRIRREHLGVMRMHADRKPALGPRGEHRAGPRDLRIVFGGQNHERARHTGRARPFNNRIKIAGELLAGDMAVTIDQGLRRDRARDLELVLVAELRRLRLAVRVFAGRFLGFVIAGADLHEHAFGARLLALQRDREHDLAVVLGLETHRLIGIVGGADRQPASHLGADRGHHAVDPHGLADELLGRATAR